MSSSGSPRASQVADRFFARRSSGERVSIDEAMTGLIGPGDVAAARSAALREIVERLRRRKSSAGAEAAVAGAAHEPSELPEVPGYDIIDVLGRGGMGAVYEAYQQSTGRRVAVKFMLEGTAASEAGRRRFEREVELIARLQHPAVVSVVDSGVHQNRCYYVMEYVEGLPLDEYVRGNGAATRRRVAAADVLSLLAAICEAVDYAHQRGVLHRDLKPSNILVDGDGRPHILDFGLAKYIDASTDGGLDLTLSQPGQILGTLAYMSPEQSRGRYTEMSVRSDVYSLGAIAYELLAGRLPVSIDGPLAEVLERLARQDPPRPSSLNPALAEDVDAILLKALEKSPADRYATAAELAADICRHLSDEPIAARPATAWYQFRKFARRNKLAVGAAASIFLIVSASAVVLGVQAQRLAEQRTKAVQSEIQARGEAERARTQAVRADRIAGFLKRMLGSIDPDVARGRDTHVMKEMLEDASRQVDTELKDEPEVCGELHQYIGLVYQALGSYAEGRVHLERALDLTRTLLGAGHARTVDLLIEYAHLLQDQGEQNTAEAVYREALGLAEKHPTDSVELAGRCLAKLALLMREQKRYEEAESFCVQNVELARRTYGDADGRTAERLKAYGEFLKHRRRFEDARKAFEEAMAINEKLVGEDSAATADILREMGELCVETGDSDEAQTFYERALKSFEKRHGPGHPQISLTLRGMADLAIARGEFPKAESILKDAIAMNRKILGDEHPVVAVLLMDLGNAQHKQGHDDEASQSILEALRIRRKTLHPESPAVATTLNELGLNLYGAGKHDEAEVLLKEALAIHEKTRGPGHSDVAVALNNLAAVMMARKDLARAEELLRRALDIWRKTLGMNQPNTIICLQNLAVLVHQRGDLRGAEKLYRQAIRELGDQAGPDDPTVGQFKENLGDLLSDMGQFAEGESLLRESVRVYRKAPAEHRRSLHRALVKLGTVLHKAGRHEDADEPQREALELGTKLYGDRHRHTATGLNNLGATLVLTGKLTEAEQLLRRALETRAALGEKGTVAEAKTRGHLGECLRLQGRFSESESELFAAGEIAGGAQPPDAELITRVNQRLAKLYDSWGRPDQAAEYRARLAPAAATQPSGMPVTS